MQLNDIIENLISMAGELRVSGFQLEAEKVDEVIFSLEEFEELHSDK